MVDKAKIIEIFEQQGLERIRELSLGESCYVSGFWDEYRIQYRPQDSTEGDYISLSDSEGSTIAIFFDAEIENIPKIIKTAKYLTSLE